MDGLMKTTYILFLLLHLLQATISQDKNSIAYLLYLLTWDRTGVHYVFEGKIPKWGTHS